MGSTINHLCSEMDAVLQEDKSKNQKRNYKGRALAEACVLASLAYEVCEISIFTAFLNFE